MNTEEALERLERVRDGDIAIINEKQRRFESSCGKHDDLTAAFDAVRAMSAAIADMTRATVSCKRQYNEDEYSMTIRQLLHLTVAAQEAAHNVCVMVAATIEFEESNAPG